MLIEQKETLQNIEDWGITNTEIHNTSGVNHITIRKYKEKHSVLYSTHVRIDDAVNDLIKQRKSRKK